MSPTAGYARVTTHLGGNLSSVGFEGDLPHRFRPPHRVGARRGRCKGFSAASRRRLLRRLASVNKLASRHMPIFVTLTYHREWDEQPGRWKAQVRAFLKRMRRAWGDLAVIWRLEYQRRGAPHFHILVWDQSEVQGFGEWVAQAWWEIAGAGSQDHLVHGTDTRRCDSWRNVTAYLAKYMAKVPDERDQSPPEHGRVWGIECREKLPVEAVSVAVSIREGVRLRRAMLRHRRAQPRSGGMCYGESSFLPDEVVFRWIQTQTETPRILADVAGPGPPGQDVATFYTSCR